MNVRTALALSMAVGLVLGGCSKTSPATTACPSSEKRNSAGQCVACLASTDCGSGTYCDSTGTCATCTASAQSCQCKANTDCPNGDFCSSGGTCQAGCRADTDCTGVLATSCCNGVCTDTNTDPAANCGGCGAPACASGDSCCSGTCSDTSTDSSNCSACGMSCNGAQCSGGQCQSKTAILGLFDATGNVENPGGSPTSVEVLEPVAFVEMGSFTVSETGFCQGYYFDTSAANGAALNAGTIGFTGYAGGDDASSNAVSSQIQCAIVDGYYQCGYGALTSGVPGTEPAETPLTPMDGNTGLFGASASIAFQIAGGTGFGSFTGSQSPSTSFPVLGDLSQVTYTAGTDTVLNLDCSSDPNDCSGVVVAIVEATQNGPSNFADPSSTFGYVLCGAPFGTFDGFDLGPAQLTITGSAISSMLGADSSLQTAVTTVFTVPLLSAEGLQQQDSEGNTVVPVAATASFGVAPLPPILPP